MNRFFAFVLIVTLTGAINQFGCGKSEQKTDAEQSSDRTQMEEMYEKLKKADELIDKAPTEGKKPVPPIHFKILMDFLPKKLEGMKAEKPEGETTQVGEWNYSTARISFMSDDGSKNADVEIYDYAYISLLYAPYQMLQNMNYKRESSDGYERSVKIGGFPGFERWEIDENRNEASVIVSDRFIVTIHTNGLPEGTAKKIAESMDLNKLAQQSPS